MTAASLWHELQSQKHMHVLVTYMAFYQHCLTDKVYGSADTEQHLFHRLTRIAYLYNGCVPWYNVVTTRVHSSVKYSQQSQLRTRATME